MPLICYEPREFSDSRLGLIAQANLIIAEYRKQGFNLTLRQLYYQFVSRNVLPQEWANSAGILNTPSSYNRLGTLVNDARMAGLIDWEAIVDRGRSSYANTHWTRPSQILEATVGQYAIDRWDNQENYVEVWVEKEALEDVLAQACKPLDVRFFACKGYTSQSAMWEAAQRLLGALDRGKQVHIIHLGDHDPSGVDMTRDIQERLDLFTRSHVHVERIALTIAQVKRYNPPPNPAKTTDSRYSQYEELYGNDSWELDALDPALLVDLITKAVLRYRSENNWAEALKLEERGRKTLESICKYFPDVTAFLRQRRKQDPSQIICAGCGATLDNPKCLCPQGPSSLRLE